MLRRIAAFVGIALGLVALALAVSMIASERGGEIVTLRTTDAAGAVVETRLWIVDADGRGWLRSGSPSGGWLARMNAQPKVEVERDGATATYTAVPLPAERARINDLFRAKYGIADGYIGMLFGRGDAIPVRLDPSS